MINSHQQRQQATQRTTLIGAIVNIFLAMTKIIAGSFGHSHALFADGLHSLADLFADGIVLLAAKYGNTAADHNHPYGHQRIETAATVFIALFLLFTGAGILWDALYHLLYQHLKAPITWLVLWIACASLFANEIVYRYTLVMAKRYQSALLTAHAWHRRSDAAASLIVIIGIIGALCGMPALDNLAALVMGALILKMAYKMGRQSLEELTDQGMDNAMLNAMSSAIQHVDGVIAMHQLRTRSMGGNIFADVHIMVDSFISVSEGHYIADRVHQLLRSQFPLIKDIIVHVDPEDDEVIPRPTDLPSRTALIALFEQSWQDLPGFEQLRWLNCHYINQHLTLSIALPLSLLSTTPQLSALYQQQLDLKLAEKTLHIYYYEKNVCKNY